MLLLYLWVQSERTIEPISVHGGVQVADMFELKLQLPLYVPSVITKQPDMLARARGPVPLKPSARQAWLQSATLTGWMPCSWQVVPHTQRR
jgi:hypothetical protein